MLDWFLAYFRFSKRAVCKMSVGRGYYNDYHDYPDGIDNYPWHMHLHKCKRCNKEFYI